MYRHLTRSKNLFVNDAAVGAHPSAEVRVRVISDSGAVSLFLKYDFIAFALRFADRMCSHYLPGVPRRSVREFQPDVVVYIATSLTSGASAFCKVASRADSFPRHCSGHKLGCA